MSTRALFVRHGQSVSNADPEAAALPAEVGDRLSGLGHRQAEAAGEVLAGAGPTLLITSPMLRARETTEAMNRSLGLPVTELDFIHELREADDYTSLAPPEQKRERWSARMAAHSDDPSHAEGGAESFADVLGRVHRLKAVLEALPEGEVPMIVTHGLFLRFFLFDSLLGEAFGPVAVARLWRVRSLNCGLSIFESGERWHAVDPEIRGWTCITWMARPWDPPERPAIAAPASVGDR